MTQWLHCRLWVTVSLNIRQLTDLSEWNLKVALKTILYQEINIENMVNKIKANSIGRISHLVEINSSFWSIQIHSAVSLFFILNGNTKKELEFESIGTL